MAIGRREFVVGSLAASVGRRFSAIRAMSTPAATEDVSSKPITGVKVGTAIKLGDNQGDTWITAGRAMTTSTRHPTILLDSARGVTRMLPLIALKEAIRCT